jgi:RsiW-degrading membrane proteinase PrsW (M82 family)
MVMNSVTQRLGRRYGLPLAALLVTLASFALVLWWDDSPGVLLLVAAFGPPVTALLLARAAVGSGVRWGRMARAFALGGTLIPAIVIAVHGFVLSVVFALVEPLTDAGRSLFDDLRVDAELLDVLTNPWAVVFLVELALVAPIAEESLKPLAARIARPGSRRDAFLLGAAAGAGFAAVENVLYASGWFWSFDWFLPVAVLRSTGAALHLLGAGLISVALYERRERMEKRTSIAGMWGIAVGVHALWNGSIAVAIILYEEQARLAGIGGSALEWGIALDVMLGVIGMVLLGAIVAAARWATPDRPTSVSAMLDLARPTVIAGWAGLAALMIVPATIMILVFPEFVAF